MLEIVNVLLEKSATGDKRKRSASESEGPTKRRRMVGGKDKTNIYRGNHACFHPLFPLYAITESLYQMSFSLENETSFDNVPFFQYINFVAKLVNGIITELQTPVGQLKATYYGLALREMLISTNMYLHTEIYTKTMGMSREQYLPIQLMNSVLSTPYINTEKSREGVFIHLPLFAKFLKNLNMHEVVERTPNTTVVKARGKIRQIMEKMCQQIMDDRGVEKTTQTRKVLSAPVIAAISANLGLKVVKSSSQKKKTRSSNKLTRKKSNKIGQIHPVAPAGVSTPEVKKSIMVEPNVSPQKLQLFGKRKLTKSGPNSGTRNSTNRNSGTRNSGKTKKIRKLISQGVAAV